MKKSIVFKLLFWIVLLFILFKVTSEVVIEPLIRQKIQAAIDNSAKEYRITLNNVHVNLIRTQVTVKGIKVLRNDGRLQSIIPEIRIKRIHLIKAIFHKEIHIHEIIASDIKFYSILSVKSDEPQQTRLSGAKIRIDKIVVELSDFQVVNETNAQQYGIHKGKVVVYNLDIGKNDTISLALIHTMDFNFKQFISVTSDSNYTLKTTESVYNAITKTLYVKEFQLLPNYPDYVFADRHKYETDRLKILVDNLNITRFNPFDYFKSRDLVCSIVRLDTLEVEVFRDKRKEFLHVPRKTFQALIYDYPGVIRIDTIAINSGSVTYIEHAEEAREAGYITFKKLRAKINSITNDTLYIESHRSLNLYGEALLMGKGKLKLQLTAPLLDPLHTFSLEGSLKDMRVEELNPILENSAFMLATGDLESMNFSFTANNINSTGTLSVLYKDLDVTITNKSTGDTTAIKERLMSLIANLKLKNSNPLRGNEPRKGTIEYQRDPEKFLFSYCFKSILSGIKSTLTNDHKSKKNP